MKIYYFLILTITLIVFGAACQNNQSSSNSPANQPENKTVKVVDPQNSNTAINSSQPEADKPDPGKAAAGSLATPTEAYKTAYTARKNKDVEGLKHTLSKIMLDFFAGIGKSDNKSLDDELKEMMKAPQAATPDSRNEKITGETATLEYLDPSGSWKTMDFVKEADGWKLTAPGKPSAPDNDKKPANARRQPE